MATHSLLSVVDLPNHGMAGQRDKLDEGFTELHWRKLHDSDPVRRALCKEGAIISPAGAISETRKSQSQSQILGFLKDSPG
jgi:hypothetical protein